MVLGDIAAGLNEWVKVELIECSSLEVFSAQESKKKTYLKTLVEISHRTQSLINLNKVMH